MLNLNEALARERVRQLPKPFAFGREEAERISPAFLQEALQHAKPLDMVLNAFSPDPSELYVSAMQEAIRENPDADASLQSGLFFLEQRAIQKLFRHRVDYDLLPEVLVHGMGTLLKAKSRDPEELWKTALARTVSAVNPLCSQPEFLAVETPQKLAKDFLYQSVSGEEIYASFLKQALLQNPELSREDAREAVASGIHQFFSPKGFAFQQVTHEMDDLMDDFLENIQNMDLSVPEEVSLWMDSFNQSGTILHPASQDKEAPKMQEDLQGIIVAAREGNWSMLLKKEALLTYYQENILPQIFEASLKGAYWLSVLDASEEEAVTLRREVERVPAPVPPLPHYAEAKDRYVSVSVEPPSEVDLQFLRDLEEKLDAIQKMQHQSKAVPFWEKVLDTFEKSLAAINIEKYAIVSKILVSWSETLAKATKEMALSENPELQGIHERAMHLEDSARKNEAGWDAVFRMANQLTRFSKAMLEETRHQIQKTPLLENPSVYLAEPWEEFRKSPTHKPRDIYCSALRKVVLDHPGIGIYEADQNVLELLQPFRLTTEQRGMILAHSPRYRNLSEEARASEAVAFIRNTQNLAKSQQK